MVDYGGRKGKDDKMSATYKGERCLFRDSPFLVGPKKCGEPATHKVGEEFPPDWPPEKYARHNLTTYLCCAHFVQLMGAGLECCFPTSG